MQAQPRALSPGDVGGSGKVPLPTPRVRTLPVSPFLTCVSWGYIYASPQRALRGKSRCRSEKPQQTSEHSCWGAFHVPSPAARRCAGGECDSYQCKVSATKRRHGGGGGCCQGNLPEPLVKLATFLCLWVASGISLCPRQKMLHLWSLSQTCLSQVESVWLSFHPDLCLFCVSCCSGWNRSCLYKPKSRNWEHCIHF